MSLLPPPFGDGDECVLPTLQPVDDGTGIDVDGLVLMGTDGVCEFNDVEFGLLAITAANWLIIGWLDGGNDGVAPAGNGGMIGAWNIAVIKWD